MTLSSTQSLEEQKRREKVQYENEYMIFRLYRTEKWTENVKKEYMEHICKYDVETMDMKNFMNRISNKKDNTSDVFKAAINNLDPDHHVIYGVQQKDVSDRYGRSTIKYRFLINTRNEMVQIIQESPSQTFFRTYGNVSEFPLKSFMKFPVFVVHPDGYFMTLWGTSPKYDGKFTLNYKSSQNITIEDIWDIMTKSEYLNLLKLRGKNSYKTLDTTF
jgi:hypothetical protein